MHKTSLVWLRRDLRLTDQPALSAAIESSKKVVIVYIHAPEEEKPWQPGAASNWWLHYSLRAFADSLKPLKSRLVIRHGGSLDCLLALCEECGATGVYWNRLYDPATVERDTQVKKALQEQGIEANSFGGALLREPWQVHKDDGDMYRVYTPFSRKYMQLPAMEEPLPPPASIPTAGKELKSLALVDLDLIPHPEWFQGFTGHWQPGEQGAFSQLNKFIDHGVLDYATGRDFPATDGVSRLSPHLHFGELSPRQIWNEIQFHAQQMGDSGVADAGERVVPYLKQLVWRDFAHHILYHLPHTESQPFNPRFNDFEWDQNDELLRAWQRGQTGIPLVDAGMRQLWQTGWMHNRIRMLVASFLTKNGLIHWLEGARWFWDTLVDANLANNSMGWQWTAGCGVDAAPYFRIFSPARQGERFDKDGAYVRRWVPELAGLPDKYIHQPWLASADQQSAAGIHLGNQYPHPVVDLSHSRKEALARYKQLRGKDELKQ